MTKIVEDWKYAEMVAEIERLRAELESVQPLGWQPIATAPKDAEPVAWLNPYGGVLQHLSTGIERSTYTIPLYTAPPTAEQIRRQAIEECLAVCEKQGDVTPVTASTCRKNIRSLLEKTE